ncbi:upstream stimulatory factor 2 isoform X1 [Gambusia affinis]|uniref:upstream stimulatory factor 2 isoform X1 n=1 Tax=Gambusia affinis TaxID=33528 RepID=UPI001CDC0246|nr:upstream stimulatory factor 2 isoform X1 [Gambusia affinis]
MASSSCRCEEYSHLKTVWRTWLFMLSECQELVVSAGETVGTDGQAVTITSVPQAAFTDHGVQYQFRTENNGGQVTYRVVQVTEDQLEATAEATGAVSVVSAAAFAGAPQAVAQAVIQNSFSNGGSPGGDAVGGETRFAYFPAAAVTDGTAVSVQGADPAITQAGGQFYVMMSPSEVLQTASPRTIAPRTHTYTTKVDGPRAPRDERRRAQHNEVERRRRDKINNWIVTLSKLIPDCSVDTRTGAVSLPAPTRPAPTRPAFLTMRVTLCVAQSKGGILSKACDYIRELRQNNQRLQDGYKEVERVEMDNELLRQQMEELKNENALLRAQLQQHGVEVNGDETPQ